MKYDQESPVQPRYDVNAPDLYIPSMGYVTYVLLAGFMLGWWSFYLLMCIIIQLPSYPLFNSVDRT